MESLLYWVEYRVSSFLYPHLVMMLSRQRAFPNRVRPEKADFPSSRLLSLIFLRLLSLVLTSMSPPIWQLKKHYFHSFWKYSIIKPFRILVTQSCILSIKEVTQKWSWRRVLLVQVWVFLLLNSILIFCNKSHPVVNKIGLTPKQHWTVVLMIQKHS